MAHPYPESPVESQSSEFEGLSDAKTLHSGLLLFNIQKQDLTI